MSDDLDKTVAPNSQLDKTVARDAQEKGSAQVKSSAQGKSDAQGKSGAAPPRKPSASPSEMQRLDEMKTIVLSGDMEGTVPSVGKGAPPASKAAPPGLDATVPSQLSQTVPASGAVAKPPQPPQAQASGKASAAGQKAKEASDAKEALGSTVPSQMSQTLPAPLASTVPVTGEEIPSGAVPGGTEAYSPGATEKVSTPLPRPAPEAPRTRSEKPAAPGTAGPGGAPLPKIQGYDIQSALGRGTFGSVWKARNQRTGADVALKLFSEHVAADWDYLRREIECLIKVGKHPNIVTLLDADFIRFPPYYTMEMMSGSLDAEIRKNRERLEKIKQSKAKNGKAAASEPAEDSENGDDTEWSPWPDVPKAIRWFEEMVRGIAYVHGKAFLHCDLKPANVLLDDEGHVRIVDFGQALLRGRDKISMGTLFFMPPEQTEIEESEIHGHPDVRWDIYALGATIFMVLTGRPPRAGKEQLRPISTAETISERLKIYRDLLAKTPLTPLAEILPGIPPEFAAIVEKCLEIDPEKRYGSAPEILEDLDRMRRKQPMLCYQPWTRYYLLNCFVRRNTIWLVPMLALFAVLIITQVHLARKAFRQYHAVVTVMHKDGTETSTEIYADGGAKRDTINQSFLQVYVKSLAEIQDMIAKGMHQQALSRLDDCEVDWRHWEWGRLKLLASRGTEGQQPPPNLGVEKIEKLPATSVFIDLAPNGFAFILNETFGQSEVVQSKDGQRDPEFMDESGRLFRSISIAADGKTAAMLRANGEILIRRGPKFDKNTLIGTHQGAVAIAISPDGERYATIDNQGVLKIWIARYGQEALAIPDMPADAAVMRWSPEANKIVVFDHKNGATLIQATKWK